MSYNPQRHLFMHCAYSPHLQECDHLIKIATPLVRHTQLHTRAHSRSPCPAAYDADEHCLARTLSAQQYLLWSLPRATAPRHRVAATRVLP